MGLTEVQSAPGNRISGPDGNEVDIIARVATDAGPFVIIARTDGDLPVGVLVSEGALRDHQDVAHVGATADAKAEAYAKAQQAEADQAAADRQARIDAKSGTTDTTDTTGVEVGNPSAAAPPTPSA